MSTSRATTRTAARTRTRSARHAGAIVAMASALELEVTAEGVETKEQLRHLKRLHCPRAQGFHLARPISAPAMNRLITNAKRWPVD